MKVVFERKSKVGDLPSVPVPPSKVDEPEVMKVYSDRKDVGIGRSNPKVDLPKVEPKPDVPVSPVADEVEYLKSKYLGVFGLDSIVPSNKDVLTLNLLFAIYSELVGLRDDLRKGD